MCFSPQAKAAQQQLSRGQMALETAVVLLESVLPSLLDPSVLETQAPAFRESLVALLQPLLALRYTDPVMVALVRSSQGAEGSWGVCLFGGVGGVEVGERAWLLCCSRCWPCATQTQSWWRWWGL
jgi:hypothetical protein